MLKTWFDMIWHNLDDSQRKKYAYIIIEAGNILFLDYFEDRSLSTFRWCKLSRDMMPIQTQIYLYLINVAEMLRSINSDDSNARDSLVRLVGVVVNSHY